MDAYFSQARSDGVLIVNGKHIIYSRKLEFANAFTRSTEV